MINCPVYLTNIDVACGTNIGGVRETAISNFGAFSFEFDYQLIDTLTEEEYTALDEADKAKYEKEGDLYYQYAKDVDGEKIISSIKTATLNTGFEKAKRYAFREQTASYTESLQANDNGVNFWEATINLVFSKLDAAKRLSIQSLMQGQCQAIVTDNNKKHWLVGYERPLRMTTGDVGTGTAYSDDNAYTISLTASSTILSIPVSEEAYNAMVE